MNPPVPQTFNSVKILTSKQKSWKEFLRQVFEENLKKKILHAKVVLLVAWKGTQVGERLVNI